MFIGDIKMKVIEMRGQSYKVTKQELKARYFALKMGATVINRSAFEAWKCLYISLCGKRYYIDYSDKLELFPR